MNTGTFRTEDGTAVTAVTAEEMRAVDRVAVEAFGIDLLQLMENAGRTLAGRVREMTDGPVAVVAGNGGNGGGGLCCARHLANRDVPVTVVLDRDGEELDGAAAVQYRILRAMGVPVETGTDRLRETAVDVVVDALIGYGLTGAPRGTAADLVTAMNEPPAAVVSLDVPTGRDATTGDAEGAVVDPDRVVTLALPKTGLAVESCPLVLVDISVPAGVYESLDIPYETPFGSEYWETLVAGSRYG